MITHEQKAKRLALIHQKMINKTDKKILRPGTSASAGGNIGFLGAKADISKQIHISSARQCQVKHYLLLTRMAKLKNGVNRSGERDSLQKIASNMRSESSGVTASKDLTRRQTSINCAR